MMSHLWGDDKIRKKIRRKNWKEIGNNIIKGGLGIKQIGNFNEVMIAKQGWRLIINPDYLVVKTLETKYHPKKRFSPC